MNTNNLESEFSARLRDSIRQSHDLGYHPTRFEQMLDDQGALGLVRKLIKSGEIQDGFKAVVKLGRKDLTMESIMLEPQFKSLIAAGELEAATWRLSQT
jgi:hypothetical protein